MTNKKKIICKYKFHDDYHFNGKPYCTCFNELCEDISIICDHNCQIYEDFKQLALKTQECEELKERLERTEEDLKHQCVDCMNIKSDRYRKALEEIEEEITALHYITIPFHRGITHELADIVQEYKNKILNIINKAKG